MLRKFKEIWVNINRTHAALATVAAFLVAGIAVETATSMVYVGGAFVAAVVLIGPEAPLGGVTGLIIYDLFHGTVGHLTLVTAAWTLVFAGSVMWLAGRTSTKPDTHGLKSILRTTSACTGMVMIAGINTTAFTAWLAMILGSQPFYTAAIGILPGVATALGICAFGLVSLGVTQRFAPPLFTLELPGQTRSEELTDATTVGVFIIGTGWLGGTFALDILVHDLGLFATASQFRAFVTGILGSGSLTAAVGTPVLVGIYRYGELAVLLSAPVAVLALLGWCNYHKLVLSPIVRRRRVISRGPTDD